MNHELSDKELSVRTLVDGLENSSAQFIDVCQDSEGLRIAAAEMFEESLDAEQREKNERLAEMSADPESVLRASQSKRTLSPGYYLWLVHCIETIEQPMEDGVTINGAELDADEMLALHILRHARAEFRRNHPPCDGCGRLLRNSWDKTCTQCMRAKGAKAMRAEN